MHRRRTIRGRFVIPIDGPPIPGGTVTFEAGRIVGVGGERECESGNEIEDLGNVAICPGFVNAHVHWEFSRLKAPLGNAGESLIDWVPRVLAYRQETGCAEDPEAVRVGKAESRDTGTALAGEITQPDASTEILAEGPPETVAFLELIGPTVSRAKDVLAATRTRIEDVASRGTLRLGLSPHAPFTVHPTLLEDAVQLARKWNLPVAMHYAESPEERRFLDEGTGPFRDMLESLGAWSGELGPRSEILHVLSSVPRALIIHGTYLNATETAFLADHAETMSVIYCPRSTAWFGAKSHPVETLLEAGVRVALGTDGRGSTPSLNMLDEMRFLKTRHPEAAPETILKMATQFGAEALGIEDEFGSLAPGKRAAFAVIRLPEREGEAYGLILDPEARVGMTGCDSSHRR